MVACSDAARAYAATMLRILYHLRARLILTLRCTQSVSCSAVLLRFSHLHRQAPENGYHPCGEYRMLKRSGAFLGPYVAVSD